MAHRAAGLTVLALLLFSGMTVVRGEPAELSAPRAHALAQTPRTADAEVSPRSPAQEEIGLATFYGRAFHGRTMANGNNFDMHDPTIAASNRWPLGTRLVVRRVPSSPWDEQLLPAELARYRAREIIVVIEDRGDFSHALDLSAAAFAMLGRQEEGVIRVAVELLP